MQIKWLRKIKECQEETWLLLCYYAKPQRSTRHSDHFRGSRSEDLRKEFILKGPAQVTSQELHHVRTARRAPD
jgi:hypothetical protein